LVELQEGCEECIESAVIGLPLFSAVLQDSYTHIAVVGGTDVHSDALLSIMEDLHWNVTAVSIQYVSWVSSGIQHNPVSPLPNPLFLTNCWARSLVIFCPSHSKLELRICVDAPTSP
jgi:hypothetical protein